MANAALYICIFLAVMLTKGEPTMWDRLGRWVDAQIASQCVKP